MKRIVNVAVGSFIFLVAYQFWFGSGIFNGLFSQSVADGNLGAGPADLLSQLLELALTIVSTVGAFTITVLVGGIRYIVTALDGDPSTAGADTEWASDSIEMPNQQVGDYTRVLLQAVHDRDAPLTIMMAERMAGEKYITTELLKPVEKSQTLSS